MEYKTLKRTGWQVSEVSFGCMSLTSSGSDNDDIIGKAIDSGINLFDTADLYEHGKNEQLLGRALKGRRKDVYISTKVGNRWREDGSGWDWCPRRDYILKAVDASLSRLQTDYIDLYLLHGGTMEDPMDETIEAFERLVEQGKIRHYGLSSIRPNKIREYVKRSDIAAVMTQYSLLDRRPEEETLQLLQQKGIGVLARGTVAGGLLAGKPSAAYLGMEAAEVGAILSSINYNLPEEMPLSHGAIRYVTENPAITTAVAGIRTIEQLEDAVAASGTPLTPSQRRALQESWEGNVYKEHR